MSGRKFLAWFIGIALLAGTAQAQPDVATAPDFRQYSFKTSTDSNVNMQTLTDVKATVFVFLSPECPISQQCTQALNALANEYISRGFLFFGVIPGSYYSAEEIQAFKTKYRMPFPLLMDNDYKLTRQLAATITPQAIVVGNNYGTLYSGAIDNAFRAPGNKNAHTSAHYLADALASIHAGQAIAVAKTSPVGCWIEFLKATVNE